jgi:hypothetical protein
MKNAGVQEYRSSGEEYRRQNREVGLSFRKLALTPTTDY